MRPSLGIQLRADSGYKNLQYPQISTVSKAFASKSMKRCHFPFPLLLSRSDSAEERRENVVETESRA
jgi:hypothetical protein